MNDWQLEKTSRQMTAATDIANRRFNPAFSKVLGFVPKRLAMRFKIACARLEIKQTDGIEKAVTLWLEHLEAETGK